MLAERYASLTAEIDGIRASCPLAAQNTRLIAVSKGQGEERIEAALRAGIRDFGENRVQEALSKWPRLREKFPACRLHLIGPLQSNKAREAVAFFDCIHTLDRPRLAEALAEEMARQSRRIPCLIQVNTGQEPQKAGIHPREADALIERCRDTLRLPVEGLMCVPPQAESPAPHFALLREIALRHGLRELSMGMSGDYPAALRFGATMIRIGTALFGAREKTVSSA